MKRNYIGLVSDEPDRPHAPEAPPPSRRPMKDYLRDLLAAMFELRGDAR